MSITVYVANSFTASERMVAVVGRPETVVVLLHKAMRANITKTVVGLGSSLAMQAPPVTKSSEKTTVSPRAWSKDAVGSPVTVAPICHRPCDKTNN